VPRCDEAAVRPVVEHFVASFNAGETAAVEQLLAPVSRFQWYSTTAPGERFDPQARDRSSLLEYVAARHAQHERLELTRLKFNAIAAGYANFDFELVRTADDGLPPTDFHGKGALDCLTWPATVAVWSMGRPG
jgi:hypothetical protein